MHVDCGKASGWEEAIMGWGGVAGHELGEVETASGREDGVLETSFEPLK